MYLTIKKQSLLEGVHKLLNEIKRRRSWRYAQMRYVVKYIYTFIFHIYAQLHKNPTARDIRYFTTPDFEIDARQFRVPYLIASYWRQIPEPPSRKVDESIVKAVGDLQDADELIRDAFELTQWLSPFRKLELKELLYLYFPKELCLIVCGYYNWYFPFDYTLHPTYDKNIELFGRGDGTHKSKRMRKRASVK